MAEQSYPEWNNSNSNVDIPVLTLFYFIELLLFSKKIFWVRGGYFLNTKK